MRATTGHATALPSPAKALSEVLGGLPLAHEQAAAYCERLGISLAEYGRRFDRTRVRLLDDVRHAPTEYHDGRTVAKTFGLVIEEAAKLHPATEPLIRSCSTRNSQEFDPTHGFQKSSITLLGTTDF
jgi:hypothetical protein